MRRVDRDYTGLRQEVKQARTVPQAISGTLGGWKIGKYDIKSDDETVELSSRKKRLTFFDTFDNPMVVIGWLGGIEDFSSDTRGWYIAPGNKVVMGSGAEFTDGSYEIQKDAAYLVLDSVRDEIVRLGSIGAGDVGFNLGKFNTVSRLLDAEGNTVLDTDDNTIRTHEYDLDAPGMFFSIDDELLKINADLQVGSKLNGTTLISGGYLNTDLIDVDTLFAEEITFSNIFQSSDYVAGSQGIKFDPVAGTYEFNGSGVFSGDLSAAGGTFSGSLSAATGTFAGSLTAGSSVTGSLTIDADSGSGSLEFKGPTGTPCTLDPFAGDLELNDGKLWAVLRSKSYSIAFPNGYAGNQPVLSWVDNGTTTPELRAYYGSSYVTLATFSF